MDMDMDMELELELESFQILEFIRNENLEIREPGKGGGPKRWRDRDRPLTWLGKAFLFSLTGQSNQ